MLSSRTLTILWHIAGWVLFASLIAGFTLSMDGSRNFLMAILTPQFLFFLFIYGIIFYLNSYYLFPKLYLKKRYGTYFGIIAALLVLTCFLKPFDRLLGNSNRNNNPPPRNEPFRERRDGGPPPFDNGPADRFSDEKPPPPGNDPRRENGIDAPSGGQANTGGPAIDIVGIVLFIMACSFSSLLPILKQWRQTEQRVLQAEADKANAELSFLRAQINPHFLFNTLNNIYSLVVMKNEGGPEAIMKLSEMLRYVTDEATQDYVPLEREIQCTRNYIALQQLRLNKNVTIHFSINGQMEPQQIPPLIIMTFVENVFKYGISSHEATIITITISVENTSVRFFCENSIFVQPHEAERKGIGIANARKRLNFLYPDRHTLIIDRREGLFTVNLELKTRSS